MNEMNSTCRSQTRESNCLGLPVNISRTEQYASIGLGTVLAACGLMRGQTTGLLAALSGAAFLYRGLTGHCHGYAALGISTAECPESEHAQKAVKSEQKPEDLQRASHMSMERPRPSWLKPQMDA